MLKDTSGRCLSLSHSVELILVMSYAGPCLLHIGYKTMDESVLELSSTSYSVTSLGSLLGSLCTLFNVF